MAEVQQQDNQLQFLLADISTRIRDIEERNNSMRERIQILGQNMLNTRESTEERVSQIEKQNSQIALDLKKIKTNLENLNSEMSNFVRKDEIILVERMLKDFQPLEFIRRKDVEEMLQELETKLNPANLHLKLESAQDYPENNKINEKPKRRNEKISS